MILFFNWLAKNVFLEIKKSFGIINVFSLIRMNNINEAIEIITYYRLPRVLNRNTIHIKYF